MKKQKEGTGEWFNRLQKDPSFQAKKRAEDQAFSEREVALRGAQKPLIEALRGVGVVVESVWELVNEAKTSPRAIPILLDHLRRPYPDRVKEGIARALAVPQARIGWDALTSEFINVANAESGLKGGLAAAIAAAADEPVMDHLLGLIRDRRHGSSRVLLLSALRKSRSEKAREALVDLAKDPVFSKEIASWGRC